LGSSEGAKRHILAGDQIILLGPVDDGDVVRTISVAPPAGVTTLTTSTAYISSYPAYNNTSYVVGTSLTGVGVGGQVGEDKPPGYTLTEGGLGDAEVLVTYPSDENYLNLGCVPASIDKRVIPAGASQPMFVASTGGVSNRKGFCFAPIAGYSFSVSPADISVSANNATAPGYVWVCAADGGDKLRNIPYESFYTTVSGKAATNLTARAFDILTTGADVNNRPDDSFSTPVSGGQYYTHQSGCAYIEIVADAGAVTDDTATVTVNFGGEDKVDIPVTIN